MSTATKKPAATVRKVAAAKPRAASDGELMLWTDVEKKYAGYFVALTNSEYSSPHEFYPRKALVLGKAKTRRSLGKVFLKYAKDDGRAYESRYVATVSEKQQPRPIVLPSFVKLV